MHVLFRKLIEYCAGLLKVALQHPEHIAQVLIHVYFGEGRQHGDGRAEQRARNQHHA